MGRVPGSVGCGLGFGLGLKPSCFLFCVLFISSVIVAADYGTSVMGLALEYISAGIIKFSHLRFHGYSSRCICASLKLSK